MPKGAAPQRLVCDAVVADGDEDDDEGRRERHAMPCATGGCAVDAATTGTAMRDNTSPPMAAPENARLILTADSFSRF